MVQGGDPTGTGRGGTSIYGQRLQVPTTSTPNTHRLHKHTHISVKTKFIQSFASQGQVKASFHYPRPRIFMVSQVFLRWPMQAQIQMVSNIINSIHLRQTHIFTWSGSQFFLTLAPTPFLDKKHTIFGRVKSGIRVLQRLGAVATDNQDRYATVSAFLTNSY